MGDRGTALREAITVKEHAPHQPSNRLHCILRLDNGADHQPQGAVGEVDSGGCCRAACTVHREFRASVLD